ncbi:hypothetical protein ACQKWADRAFT_265524 [Trichoderma austrokoningii]
MGSDFGHDVFQLQLYRWNLFRRWQHDNREPDEEKDFAAYLEERKREDAEGTRCHPTPSQYLEELRDNYERRQLYYGHDDGEEGFAAYVEEKKQINIRHGSTWPGMTVDEYMQSLRHRFKKSQEFNKRQGGEVFEDGDEGFTAYVEKSQQDDIIAGREWPGMTEDQYLQLHRRRFDLEQDDHHWRRFYWLRDDHGRGGFSEYVAEAERRLARHGFTKAFEFDRDPTWQDKLTTWIEYLNFEYSYLDRHTRVLTKLQPDYDKAWQKLVDSGVLRHGETAATLSTMVSAMRRQNDLDAGEAAVHRAKQEGKQVDEQVSDAKSKIKLPEPLRRRMVKQARARIEAAEAHFREITRRCDLISEFLQGVAKRYEKTEKDLTLQRIRVQWAREQMPLIEAEVAGNCLRTRRKTKRRLEDDQCDEEANVRSPKRKKQSHEAASLSDDPGSSARAKASKHSRPAGPRDGRPLRKSRGGRQSSSNAQPVFNDAGTASTETVEPTVTRTTKRRAGGATTGLKPSRGSQSQSSAIQPQAPKQLRRSSRFATAQDKPGDTVRPSGGGRWWLRSHCKTASVTAPDTCHGCPPTRD